MKNFSLSLLVGLIVTLLSMPTASAQTSEIWAAGYIDLKYVGDPDATCSDPLRYQITLHFYRDDIPNASPLDPSKDVQIYSKSLNQTLNVTLGNTLNEGRVRQYCLRTNRTTTGGIWYRGVATIPPAKDWRISYANEFRSPENSNINPQQRFYIETQLNNFYCDTVIGVRDGIYDTIVNTPVNNTVQFTDLDPVASFCVGKQYDYKVPAVDLLDVNDRIEFEFANARTDNATTNANYVQPAFPFDQPFPVQEPQIILDRNLGTMRFTPASRFVSLVTFAIKETRTVYKKGPKISAPGAPKDTFQILEQDTIVSVTYYESRFIMDNNCNSRLPDFDGVLPTFDPQTGEDRYVSQYNATEDAFEFDCGTDVITFNLSEPMFCATLDVNDFRIGLGYDRIDTLAAFIDSVYYANITPTEAVRPLETRKADCSPSGEFNQVTLFLHKPLGPGRYNIFFRYGANDNTTIKNKCDYELPLNDPYVKLYINDNYTYNHPIDNHTYCFPAVQDGVPGYPQDSAWVPGSQFVPGKSFYTWKLNPQDPNTPVDTVLTTFLPKNQDDPQKRRWAFHDVSIPPANNPNVKQNTMVWRVGAGLDFSTYDPFTGDTLVKSICYDTDIFTVTRYENPPVEIPDFDLCPEDDFPTINLDTMVTKHNANANAIIWARSINTYNEPPTPSQYQGSWRVLSSGRSSLTVPGQQTDKYNLFATRVPLVINGHTCYERDTFLVIKNSVDAILQNDTIICEGEPFNLVNQSDYLTPELMSYEWLFNKSTIPNETNDNIMTDDRAGYYQLIVTKTTIQGTTCTATDSTDIQLADKLDSFNIACKSVTFRDGVVRQVFNWDAVDGADGYEARGITPDDIPLPWEEATGQYGLSHEITGEQMRMEVRPYNNEIPDDASCKYGPIMRAEACDIVVRPVNVFTPNGDGINDFLAFNLLELYPGSLLQVFNRWGDKIFEDPDYYNDWDGEDYQAGTYFYILKINDPLYPEPFKGTFTIIR